MLGAHDAFPALLSKRKEGQLAQKREPTVPKNALIAPSLEPVKHLSTRLQRKLVKRVKKQRKQYRSSGKPYPLVMNRPGTEEKHAEPPWASSFSTGQRVALAIASLILVMLLTLELLGIAAATHAANGIDFLILVVVALFTAAAVLINIVVNRKP